MTFTHASMDLLEQLAAFFLGNAPHEDTIGATVVEIPFYHHIAFSQSYYALSGHIVIRKDIVFQVVLGGHHGWNAAGTTSFEVLA